MLLWIIHKKKIFRSRRFDSGTHTISKKTIVQLQDKVIGTKLIAWDLGLLLWYLLGVSKRKKVESGLFDFFWKRLNKSRIGEIFSKRRDLVIM